MRVSYDAFAMRSIRFALITIAALAICLVSYTPHAGAGSQGDGGPRGDGAVSAGGRHTCVLTEAGGLRCWGANGSGQLGDGTTADRASPVDVVGLESGVVAVSSGLLHTCALMDDGAVLCWGQDDGRLGIGAPSNAAAPTPATVCADVTCSAALTGALAVAAGGSHSCTLMAGGTVRCWGDNEDGQLGDGTRTATATPIAVVELTNAVAVAAGESHTCALTEAGAILCWGSNGEGQIGDDRACGRRCSEPSQVAGLESGVAAISAGGLHNCALMTDATVRCWGLNFDGQSGDGTSDNIRVTPVAVSGLSGVTALSSNGSFRGHTCAITAAGVACWGDNANGQLGDGTTADRALPVDVVGLGVPVSAISSGDAHVCAIAEIADRVLCWGHNGAGQLGDGTQVERHTPVFALGFGRLAGDANCDGAVTSVDAALALQLGAGLTPSLPCEANADVNADGAVTSIDAALILQFVAGLLPALPA